ncbi:MAG TPA: lysylphosphatidylglycerol synthase domain-containing protein [Mycobacteriales bacterium]|nr:lysylphosphatidylglycerol synthase domain-containing protein [Mycobacteriales bacterium]
MTSRRLPWVPERLRPPTWVVRLLALAVAFAVPALTLPQLPRVSWAPVLLGLLPWVVGKYVLCPLRWHALSESGQRRRWHLRAYAESELMGLLTPGHVGADLWRVKRLTGTGMSAGNGVAEVALDRLVGAIGLAVFVVFAGSALPVEMLLTAFGIAAVALVGVLVLRRVRPSLVPTRKLPGPRQLAHGVLLSMGYQLSICALLLGTVAATGHSLSPLAVLGAFGASQLAGAVPGPHGASPRDGALVVALMALGLPWQAALGAVSLKAALAWLPALLLGGVSLLAARRAGHSLRLTAAAA